MPHTEIAIWGLGGEPWKRKDQIMSEQGPESWDDRISSVLQMKREADRAAEMWRGQFRHALSIMKEARDLATGSMAAYRQWYDKGPIGKAHEIASDLYGGMRAIEATLFSQAGAISVDAANEMAELGKRQLLSAERDEILRRFAVDHGHWLPGDAERELRKLAGLE